MRTVLFLIALQLFPVPVFAGEKPVDHIAAFAHADGLRKNGAAPDDTVAAFMLCLEMAVEAGDANYANAAGLNACHLLYGKGRVAAAGGLAARVIGELAPLPPQRAQITRRVQFFGFMERGFLAEGKLGQAMRANRAAAETLRGSFVDAAADGRALTLAEAIALPSSLRSFGWRLLERESELLDMAGRTNEAVAGLDAAARFFGNDWTAKMGAEERFYAFKLLAARAYLKDFLGEKESALAAQRELMESDPGNPSLAPSRAILRMNHLRNLSQWEGPSEEILAQARAVAEELERLGNPGGAGSLLAKMEFDLKQSRESADAMADSAARARFLGNDLGADYAERDNLHALSRLGETGLDARYFELLSKARRKGIKRAEPTLYRMYGDYLMAGNRHGEAIAMFAEALRLTRSFGWRLHEPALLGSLFEARFQSGDIAGAREVLAELDAFPRLHGDAPAQRLMIAHAIRAEALARLGEEEAALNAFATARRIGADLPPYQNGYLGGDSVKRHLARIAETKPVPASEAVPLSVQPLEVSSVAAVGESARTTFWVFNPGGAGVSGSFEISGPAATLESGGARVAFQAGGGAVALSVPRRIASGESADLELLATGGAPVDVTIAWKAADGSGGKASAWRVAWDGSAHDRVVMDASALEANPFRSIRLRHELSVPDGVVHGIAFRLRSPVPLRMEYRKPTNGAILAIDDNGDGDFTGRGDYHLLAMDGQSTAVFPLDGPEETVTAEVFVFAPDGNPLPSPGAPLVLEAEVFRDGSWVKEAENVIR